MHCTHEKILFVLPLLIALLLSNSHHIDETLSKAAAAQRTSQHLLVGILSPFFFRSLSECASILISLHSCLDRRAPFSCPNRPSTQKKRLLCSTRTCHMLLSSHSHNLETYPCSFLFHAGSVSPKERTMCTGFSFCFSASSPFLFPSFAFVS